MTGFSSALRATRNQDIVTAAGASAKLKFYDGAHPATGAAMAGTLLGTLVGGATIGTSTAAVLTVGAVTQNNATHAPGTPTNCRLTTSADVFVADFRIPEDMTFLGTFATGVDVTLGACTITEGNA